MISRRGLFRLLAGAAAAPVVGPVAQEHWIKYWRPANFVYSPPVKPGGYRLSTNLSKRFEPTIADPAMDPEEAKKKWEDYNRVFVWHHKPGTFWWLK